MCATLWLSVYTCAKLCSISDSLHIDKHSRVSSLVCLLSSVLESSPVGFIFLVLLSNAVKLIWWLPKLILLPRIQSVPFLIKLQHSWSGVFKAKPGISGSVCVDPEVLKY